MNYKPRFLIEVDSVRGDMDSPREARSAWDDRDQAVQEVNSIDRHRNVYLTDRALDKKPSTKQGAYDRGYYGLHIRTGVQTLSYLQGKIDRSTDDALDRLDDLVEQKRVEFDKRHEQSWYAARSKVSDIEWERTLHAA